MKRVLSFSVMICLVFVASCSPGSPPVPLNPSLAYSTVTPTTVNLPDDLSPEDLLNASYDITLFTGAPRVVTLSAGSYQSSSDPSAADFLNARLGEQVAFGDLDYDGDQDAAVLLSINTGGTGVFTYLLAVLAMDGSPIQAAMIFIDDRPLVHALSIDSGEITLDATLHSPEDPMCCPTSRISQGYRLYGSQLVLTQFSSLASTGERTIAVDSPAPLAEVSFPFTVSGHVTIGPFENNLAYSIFAEDNTLVTGGSVMTDSPDMGAPGNFNLPLDLGMAGITGLVRIEFSELSMKDGSLLSLGSVVVRVH